MKSTLATAVAVGFGLSVVAGCSDPRDVAMEAAHAYAVPLLEADASDCAGSLRRAQAAHEESLASLAKLKERITGVRGKDQLAGELTSAISELRRKRADFVPLCLAEARVIGAMLDERRAALGIEEMAPAWPNAPMSDGVHHCTRAATCEEYVGRGHSKDVRRFVCEEVGGAWAEGRCPIARAAGKCRRGVGSEMEAASVSYGTAAGVEAACEKPDSAGVRGTWEPFAGDAASAGTSAAARASAAPATAAAAVKGAGVKPRGVTASPAGPKPPPPPRSEPGPFE